MTINSDDDEAPTPVVEASDDDGDEEPVIPVVQGVINAEVPPAMPAQPLCCSECRRCPNPKYFGSEFVNLAKCNHHQRELAKHF